MKTAGVVLDSWKLPVFKRHLDAAGYSYTEMPGPVAGTLLFQVEYEWVHTLKPIIEAAEKECKKGKRQ